MHKGKWDMEKLPSDLLGKDLCRIDIYQIIRQPGTFPLAAG